MGREKMLTDKFMPIEILTKKLVSGLQNYYNTH